MKPITFTVTKYIAMSPDQICEEIKDLDNWTDFPGHGPIPGIKDAHYEEQTSTWLGSRIRVTSKDGQNYIEEFTKWDPPHSISIVMKEFSGTLNKIADHFLEEWHFEPQEGGTLAKRTFYLHPRNVFTRPMIMMISGPFKKAIEKHMEMMVEKAVK